MLNAFVVPELEQVCILVARDRTGKTIDFVTGPVEQGTMQGGADALAGARYIELSTEKR